MTHQQHAAELPGARLELDRMPGHWLLARMGKRTLRPGGRALTRAMLNDLAIRSTDDVVEFAPGLGATTRQVLACGPASYVGVERDGAAVRATRRILRPGDVVLQGTAAETGLASSSATVVLGEAMLTMQTDRVKPAIVREAHRLLRRGGRYGIHELALVPDAISAREKEEVQHALSHAIHVGARPLTVLEWRSMLEATGFEVTASATAPMHLLGPTRLIADEGLLGAVRFAANVLLTPEARRRVLTMRSVFKKYAEKMCAVALVARKT